MKTIVITGSTRGIGLAMAKEFLHAGCNVAISGRGEHLAENRINELESYTGNYTYIPCDVRRKPDLQRLWDASVAQWGKVDIWINNAGANAPHAFIQDTAGNDVENVITTNLTGMIFGTQIALKGMLQQKSGAIYAMEGLGSNNMIQVKTILYGTTKHALTYFMKGVAKEIEGTGIIAGRLSPGMMLTDFITKTPDGEPAAIHHDDRFKRIFNILADKPETVAKFFIPRILANTKNDAQIIWLSSMKAGMRFIASPFHKRKLVE